MSASAVASPPAIAFDNCVVMPRMSRSAIDKLPLFASMGVPEVWRFDGDRVSMLRLAGGRYEPIDFSVSLPLLNQTILTEFMRESTVEPRTAWVRRIRGWARAAAIS